MTIARALWLRIEACTWIQQHFTEACHTTQHGVVWCRLMPCSLYAPARNQCHTCGNDPFAHGELHQLADKTTVAYHTPPIPYPDPFCPHLLLLLQAAHKSSQVQQLLRLGCQWTLTTAAAPSTWEAWAHQPLASTTRQCFFNFVAPKTAKYIIDNCQSDVPCSGGGAS